MTPRQIYDKHAAPGCIAYATFLNRIYRWAITHKSRGITEVAYGDKKILSIAEESIEEIVGLLKK